MVLKDKASGRQTYVTCRVRHSCCVTAQSKEPLQLESGLANPFANEVLHRPSALLRSLVCVRLLQSRAGTGSGQGVLPHKIQDDFVVCAGLS